MKGQEKEQTAKELAHRNQEQPSRDR